MYIHKKELQARVNIYHLIFTLDKKKRKVKACFSLNWQKNKPSFLAATFPKVVKKAKLSAYGCHSNIACRCSFVLFFFFAVVAATTPERC